MPVGFLPTPRCRPRSSCCWWPVTWWPRASSPPVQLPVGVATVSIGGIYLIWLLAREGNAANRT